MKSFRSFTIALAAVVLCLSSGCALMERGAEGGFVHFFVVPKTMPDGSSAKEQMDALKVWLCDKAGGYTELPDAPGGWMNHQGGLETSDQHAFLVSAPANMKDEITAYVKKEFAETDPYVMVWKAEK
ncbi:MAG: hypothetical protein AB1921_08255 [Thermodesulfobacteriota bacterium]